MLQELKETNIKSHKMICRFELHIGLYKTESAVKFNWTLGQGLRYSCQEIKSDIDNKGFRLA